MIIAVIVGGALVDEYLNLTHSTCYTQIRMKPLVSVSVRRTDQRI